MDWLVVIVLVAGGLLIVVPLAVFAALMWVLRGMRE